MKNLVELKKDELRKIDGGGWLADIVAALVCGCSGIGAQGTVGTWNERNRKF